MPLSGSTTEIAKATMSSTCGRLEETESLSNIMLQSHSLWNQVSCRTCFRSQVSNPVSDRAEVYRRSPDYSTNYRQLRQFVTVEPLAMTRGRSMMGYQNIEDLLTVLVNA